MMVCFFLGLGDGAATGMGVVNGRGTWARTVDGETAGGEEAGNEGGLARAQGVKGVDVPIWPNTPYGEEGEGDGWAEGRRREEEGRGDETAGEKGRAREDDGEGTAMPAGDDSGEGCPGTDS